MTLPYERGKSLLLTLDLLWDLLDPKKTPGISSLVRRRAGNCLRHYPHLFDIEMLQKKAPQLLGAPGEDFYGQG